MESKYSFIRAGELNTAREFCFKIGQSWRAATLEGFKLYSDKNYSSDIAMNRPSNQLYLNEGNFNRDIWRLMVQRLVKDV
jgi:nuclear pore complex protein Nup107